MGWLNWRFRTNSETFCDVTQLLNSSLQHHFIHFKWLTNPDISYVVFLETSRSNLLSQSFNTSINGLFLLFSHPCRISLIYFTSQILRSADSHLSSFCIIIIIFFKMIIQNVFGNAFRWLLFMNDFATLLLLYFS